MVFKLIPDSWEGISHVDVGSWGWHFRRRECACKGHEAGMSTTLSCTTHRQNTMNCDTRMIYYGFVLNIFRYGHYSEFQSQPQ